MDPIDTLGFSYRLIFSSFDLAAWVWAVFFLLFAFVVLGLFWGLMWNRKWGFFGHKVSAFLSLCCALALAAVVLAWFGADRTSGWLEVQRELLSRQLANSGTLNRSAFRSAWEKLQPLGGQENLTPPSEGGNELRLNNEKEARILASAAADAVKRQILLEGPFAFGVPCTLRDPTAVAEDVVAAIPAPSYPLPVPPDNAWSKAAITAQVTTALESAAKVLLLPDQKLKTALLCLGALLLLIELVLIPIAATKDIQENPKV